MLFCGVDIGAATAKVVILEDGRIVSYSIVPTGYSVPVAAERALKEAMEKIQSSPFKFDYAVSTGYGRYGVSFAHQAITEIICHARGAHFYSPSIRTVIDIGGQDSKVIAIDEAGNVTNFVMNDKCAAGTGRFIEVMANVLQIPLEDMGRISLASQEPCRISSTCTIFAESEVVSLRAGGARREDLVAGIHKAIASRVAIMGHSVEVRREVAFTGGVAKNLGVKRFLEDILGVEITVPPEPQIIGAIGAALIARDKALNLEYRGEWI